MSDNNVENLTRYEMVHLLDFFLHTMKMEQRYRLMAEQPLTYAKLAPGAKKTTAIEVLTKLGLSMRKVKNENGEIETGFTFD